MPDDFDYSAPRERNPLRISTGYPILTHLLCAFCVVITTAYHTSNSMQGTFWYNLGHFGVQQAHVIWDGRYYALFTSFFVHLSILHIAFNMMWMWQLGSLLETSIPRWQYLLFLLSAMLVGSCCELAISGQTGAGASGVVFAIFGLLWAGRGSSVAWRQVANQNNLKYFVAWGLICIVLTYTNVLRIGNGAHWGGFLYGLAVGGLCYAPRRQPLWGFALAGLGAVCVLSLTWLPWTAEWQYYRGWKDLDSKQYTSAIHHFEWALRLDRRPSGVYPIIAYCWQEIGKEAISRHDEKAAAEAEQQLLAAIEQMEKTEKSDPADGTGKERPARRMYTPHRDKASNSEQKP